jgi:hypothetical protein
MEQIELLKYAVDVFASLGADHMVVGSMASMLYGEPRFTRDIDMVVDLHREHLDRLIQAFPAPDYYVSRDAAAEAIKQRGQFNIIHIPTANKIDVILPRNDAWGRTQLARRRPLSVLSGVTAPAAAPEDVILAKMLYYQEGESVKHLRDIASMMRVSGAGIDREYVVRWAKQLGVSEVWQLVLSQTQSE